MDIPGIQYATTSDGLTIAYSVSGSGPVLIAVPAPPDNHIQLEWENPDQRENIVALSQHRTLVRFDGRGTGLSDRNPGTYSLEERLLDLDAVVGKLGAESFELVSGAQGNQVTVAYAARHPERVRALIAINAFARGEEFLEPSKMAMMEQILRGDFKTFTEMVGAMVFGWGDASGPRYSAFFRQSVNQADAIVMYPAMAAVDLTPLLPKVQCPALILQSSGHPVTGADKGGRFAAMIPNATYGVLHGGVVEGLMPDVRLRIGQFLGEDWSSPAPEASAPPAPVPDAGIRTILFTDLEGHTTMMTRLGDQKGREVLREHERITRIALAANGGTEVKTMGDGFLASFASAQRALECAIALQRAVHPDGDASVLSGVRVRVGINAGEPIAEEDDLFGASIIAAARIAASALGGQVLVANVVRELVAGKGFLFSDTGEHSLRGLEDPVRIWELRWHEG